MVASLVPLYRKRPGTAEFPRGYLPLDEVMPALEEICAKYGNNRYERVRVTMAPSNVHRCSDAMLVALKEMATRYSTGLAPSRS